MLLKIQNFHAYIARSKLTYNNVIHREAIYSFFEKFITNEYLLILTQPLILAILLTNWLTGSLENFLIVPRKFGERAFSFAGPSAWNALPEDLRAVAHFRTLPVSLPLMHITR